MKHVALALALFALAPAAAAQEAPKKAAPAKPAAKPAPAKKEEPKKPAKKEEPKKEDDPKTDASDRKKVEPAETARAEAPAPPATPIDVHVAPPPDQSYQWRSPVIIPTITWAVFQLLPSPEIVVGRDRTIAADGSVNGGASASWGLRWQFTPLLWSWGVHRKQSPWRVFVVDPIARVSGSIELSANVEYLGGQVNRGLVRPALRTYLPLVQRGEYLAMSLGTSIYRYDSALRVAGEIGFYTLGGLFGVNATVAPTHAPLTTIVTFNVRYF